MIIEAPAGAEVMVDGVVVGEAPLAKPVDASPGAHQVVVAQNGYQPYVRKVVLARDRRSTWVVELSPTTQRIASWTLLPIGAAAVAAGIVTGVLAVVEQRAAADLERGGVLERERAQYDEAVAAKDQYRVGSGVAAGVGLAMFVTGAFLLAFDAPALPALSVTQSGGAASVSF